jgi:hypothetical protein
MLPGVSFRSVASRNDGTDPMALSSSANDASVTTTPFTAAIGLSGDPAGTDAGGPPFAGSGVNPDEDEDEDEDEADPDAALLHAAASTNVAATASNRRRVTAWMWAGPSRAWSSW